MPEEKNSLINKGAILEFFRFREIGLLFFMMLIVIIVYLRNPVFLSLDNIIDIALATAIASIAAIGQMMVILTGGIDLSVGSILGFSGMTVALINMNNWGISPIISLLIGLTVGTILGAFNGLIVSKGGVPPIITTLATMAIFRGLTFYINFKFFRGRWIYAHHLPEQFKNLARSNILKIPTLIFIAVVIYLIFYYFLNQTSTGRSIYAVGSNLSAAKVAGIKVDNIRFLPYLLSGMLCGISGVLWVSRFATAQSDTGSGILFVTITAVVVGGVSITGGSGSIIGVLLGSILLGVISNSLNIIRISPFWKLAVNGSIILLAVIVDRIIKNRAQKYSLKRKYGKKA